MELLLATVVGGVVCAIGMGTFDSSPRPKPLTPKQKELVKERMALQKRLRDEIDSDVSADVDESASS